jgi:hypothetical protein
MKTNIFYGLIATSLCSLAIAGFEVGNGRLLIRNDPGNYSIIVPDKLEIDKFDRFTEAISPRSEGTPRTRLQINVVKNTGFSSVDELIQSKPDATWTQISLAGLDGIRKNDVLPTNLHQVEIRLFSKANEMIIINLEGLRQGTISAAFFEGIERSLGTFKLNK